tara:strand:- start:155 stop:643 length:489 start_codon:yes stop_codon:yes gene_type:complete
MNSIELKRSILDIINCEQYDDDLNIVSLRHIVSMYEPKEQSQESSSLKTGRPRVPVLPSEQCGAKKSSGLQCTRRRKNAEKYCGTHMKGCPHGDISNNVNETAKTRYTVNVWMQVIDEIPFYIDDNLNVYQADDIISNKVNPKVIAKYEINEQGEYVIPSFY